MKTMTTRTGLVLDYHSTINNIEVYTYANYRRVYIKRADEVEETLLAKCRNKEDVYKTIRDLSINESYNIVKGHGFESIREYVQHLFDRYVEGVDISQHVEEIETALHNSNFSVMYYVGQYMNASSCNQFSKKYKLN